MTKFKIKAGKEFNTESIIVWGYGVFFFFAFDQFFQRTNWFRISYFNCTIILLIYAIQEKSILKDFVLDKGGLIKDKG